MSELLALIILLVGFFGITTIITKKAPALAELPHVPFQSNLKETIIQLGKKIKTANPFKDFSNELFLQKVLSKIRILTLKTENKTSDWLQKLRERTKNKKIKEKDNYWQEINQSANQIPQKEKNEEI